MSLIAVMDITGTNRTKLNLVTRQRLVMECYINHYSKILTTIFGSISPEILGNDHG